MNNTIIRTSSVLRLLSQHPDGLTITEICKALSLPKSTVFDIVHTLEAENIWNLPPPAPSPSALVWMLSALATPI